MRSSRHLPYTLLALALLAIPLSAAASTTERPQRAPAHARTDARLATVHDHLRAGRADLAWSASAQWTDRRGRPLTKAERQNEAVRVAMRLRDTSRYRTAAAFASEIDRHLATAENTLRANRGERALSTVAAEARAEEARIIDLRASIAVGFRMDTAAARELRARSAELAPERLPRRLKPREREPDPEQADRIEDEHASEDQGGRP